ncbi:alpha/beta hydrolase family protein [Nocardia callitridis]|uniref:Prolyl oligopeptidase family serine peptidase n=1 Tax=Nocardia callitridis TaxID=648753 RepID=A0ABP9KPZ7_9NOCA
METITGTAAGVPFTALPPAEGTTGSAPLIVTWHMLDAPRTDPAFAAALPMAGVPAWRVHLGMPMCGARMVDGRVDAVLELIREDPLLAYLAPFLYQAADEFPAALAAVRDQLPVDDGPVAILGGSLGGAVALEVLARAEIPLAAVALVNPAVRIRSAVELIETGFGQPYPWTEAATETADALDYVRRFADRDTTPPLLLVSGELDHPAFRADANDLVDVLRKHHSTPEDVELTTVANLAHPLAEEPGLAPAPQLPTAAAVDAILTRWFIERLTAR